MIVHAGLIARRDQGPWRGVLIEGPSGSGKSDLALRALERGFRLVADDRVLLWVSAGRLFGRAPDPLAGLMEVRGLGVAPQAALRLCEIVMAVRSGPPERLPEPKAAAHLGVHIPLIELDFHEASAPAKLGRALASFDASAKRGI
ncbi:MAG: HPr kinase/phosphorylase [Phenylobacterium sp.]